MIGVCRARGVGVGGLGLLLAVGAPSRTLEAQQWNDQRVLELVRRATARRAQQAADSGLVDYQATAHGYVTFLAQLGEGFREPPKVLKADELALQVYWKAPNLSKQRIIGRRDTTLLPTDIQYHRDHLGIVQNNFPAIIRLGEGDEVRDVPHPLSDVGLQDYDFALSDSLRIAAPGRVINVYEVKVRPKDDTKPRVIGAVYLDRDNAHVVRMALNFTRAAFLDEQLEDLFVVLENGLVGTRFWLPRRQEVEIRRTATWLDYPVRGIIRGRWEVGDYQLNIGLTREIFGGPEIVQAPTAVLRSYDWPSRRILDSLPPDVRAVTPEEVQRVQVEARALVREQALKRQRASPLAARSLSDFARFNKVEGLSLGAGASAQVGGGFAVSGAARYGLDDHAMKGDAELAWRSGSGGGVRFFLRRHLSDVSAVQERSVLTNSVASQEFASDYADLVREQGIGVSMTRVTPATNWTLELATMYQRAATVHATPANGQYLLTLPADSTTSLRATVIIERPSRLWVRGIEMRARAEVRADAFSSGCPAIAGCVAPTTLVKGSLDIELERPVGGIRVVSRTFGAASHAGAAIPAQELVYLGGPVSAPGFDFHSIVGDAGGFQRLELRMPAPFVAFSLGRFGRAPTQATVAPFASLAAVHPADLTHVSRASAASPQSLTRLTIPQTPARASVGIGVLMFFEVLRVDLARGLNDGRWTFYFDVNRAFWSVL